MWIKTHNQGLVNTDQFFNIDAICNRILGYMGYVDAELVSIAIAMFDTSDEAEAELGNILRALACGGPEGYQVYEVGHGFIDCTGKRVPLRLFKE